MGYLVLCSGIAMKLKMWNAARFKLRTLMSPRDENGYLEDIEKQIVKKETPYIGEEMSEWDGYMVIHTLICHNIVINVGLYVRRMVSIGSLKEPGEC